MLLLKKFGTMFLTCLSHQFLRGNGMQSIQSLLCIHLCGLELLFKDVALILFKPVYTKTCPLEIAKHSNP